MPGILQFSPTALYFEQVVTGGTSVMQSATLENTDAQTALISYGTIPVNFLARYAGDTTYVSTLGTTKVGRPFSPGVWYFQDVDGTITTDPNPTNVVIGRGNTNGSIRITIEAYLLDENGYPIEDESGEGLIADDPPSGGGGGFFP